MTVARLTVTLVALHLGSFAPAVESASSSGNGADSQSFQTEYVDIDRFLPAELLKPMERDFEDSTLEEFLKTVGEMTGYVVRPDVNVLFDAGLRLKDPVHARVKGFPLYLALRRVLENVNGVSLDWKLEGEVLVISTREMLSFEFETITVDVVDLLQAGCSPRSLVQLLERTFTGKVKWQALDGEGGQASIFGTSLVVRQSRDVNRQIRCLLGGLKSDASKVWLMKNPWDRQAEQALKKSVSLDFPETTLQQVVDFLSKETGIRIELDRPMLVDAGVLPESEVSLTISSRPLKTVLQLLLENVNGTKLIALVEGGRLLILPEDSIENRMSVAVYHVPTLTAQGSGAALIDLLKASVSDEVKWIDKDGEGGDAVFVGSQSLVVRQSFLGFQEIDPLLIELLAVAATHPPSVPRPPESDETVEVRRRVLSAGEAEDLKRTLPKLVSPNSWAQLPDGTQAAIETIVLQKSEVAKSAPDQNNSIPSDAPESGVGRLLLDLAQAIVTSRKSDPSEEKVILFVRQTRAVQDEIETFIDGLKPKPVPPVPAPFGGISTMF